MQHFDCFLRDILKHWIGFSAGLPVYAIRDQLDDPRNDLARFVRYKGRGQKTDSQRLRR
jgi:hypothetical protein